MARPRVQRSTDSALMKRYFRAPQQQRFDTLKVFLNQIRNPVLLEEVKADDRLFAAILELATEEYGVRLSDIAEKIDVSPAAVGRWAKHTNLPLTAMRPVVVGAVASLLESYVQRQVKERPELPRGRVFVH